MSGNRFPTFRARGLLFDLDGTLVDSAPDIAGAANRMLGQLGLGARPVASIREWVGNGAPRLVKRVLTGRYDGEPDPALYERALPLFYDHYAAHCCEESVLYDGVAETLAVFRNRGFRMACVTNKPERHTLPLLSAIGLADFFQCTVAGDTLDTRKPNPAPLLHAAAEIGVDPKRCVMVGDSVSDIRSGNAAGMPMLCLTYGYNQGIDLSATTADALVDSFTDLVELIEFG